MEKLYVAAHQHAYERSKTEKAFVMNKKDITNNKINQLLTLSHKYENQKVIPIKDVILNGVLAMQFRIIKTAFANLSPYDVEQIYPRSKSNPDDKDVVLKLHYYLDNQDVYVIKVSGMGKGFLLQHWKTFVRHFLIANKCDTYPLQNLVHICDGDDYEYINAILNQK